MKELKAQVEGCKRLFCIQHARNGMFSINTLIDIAQYIVMKKKLGFPSTYRELFEILEEAGYISEEELKAFKRLVFLRNLIAHEYYRISENELLEMVNLLEKCSDFVNRVKVEAGKL